MKRGKKAQITIFIILGVMLFAGGLTYYVSRSSSNDFSKEDINPQLVPVYSFVEDCIKQTGENAVYELSKKGGYYSLPKLNTNNIPYYFYEDKSYTPSKKDIETQLSLYIDENLKKCINDFKNLESFNITGKKIKTISKIQEDSILFSVKYPLSIIKESKTYYVENFQTEITSRFPVIYASILELMTQQLNHTKSVCLTCINNIAEKNDFYFEINYLDKQTIIFIILDNRTKINNNTLVYQFAYDLK
ncbi:MAG: hypothetical protein WC979_06730 [Candidatus Pacearchaeota archaeon]|jgi:hypothetical protein